MLQAGTTKTVSFNVNVLGTQSVPQSVKAILGTTPELGFVAKQIGDIWSADIQCPSDAPDSVDFRIEVVINNRLLIPINKRISIERTTQSQPEKIEIPSVQPDLTVESSADAYTDIDEIEVPEAIHETPPEKIDLKGPQISPKVTRPTGVKTDKPIVKPKVSILKQFEADAAVLSQLDKVSKRPVKKAWPRLESGLPKTNTVTEKVMVKISEIDALATKNFGDVLKESKAHTQPVKKTRAPRKVESIVKLVKGDIIYE